MDVVDRGKTSAGDYAHERDLRILGYDDRPRTRALLEEYEVGRHTRVGNGVTDFLLTFSYDDPLYHSISYAPTNKDEIDRQAAMARRLLTPHALILQMLLSRLQAARYRKLGIMRLIQRLILRSACNHRKMRCVGMRARRARSHVLVTAPMRLLAKPASLSCFSGLSYCEACVLTSTRSTCFASRYTPQPSPGSPHGRSRSHPVAYMSVLISVLQMVVWRQPGSSGRRRESPFRVPVLVTDGHHPRILADLKPDDHASSIPHTECVRKGVDRGALADVSCSVPCSPEDHQPAAAVFGGG
jgi:hypothetical protein